MLYKLLIFIIIIIIIIYIYNQYQLYNNINNKINKLDKKINNLYKKKSISIEKISNNKISNKKNTSKSSSINTSSISFDDHHSANNTNTDYINNYNNLNLNIGDNIVVPIKLDNVISSILEHMDNNDSDNDININVVKYKNILNNNHPNSSAKWNKCPISPKKNNNSDNNDSNNDSNNDLDNESNKQYCSKRNYCVECEKLIYLECKSCKIKEDNFSTANKDYYVEIQKICVKNDGSFSIEGI